MPQQKAKLPRLNQDLRDALIQEDLCPECVGPLTDELVCEECCYDAVEEYVDE